jgi:hypothetical protein
VVLLIATLGIAAFCLRYGSQQTAEGVSTAGLTSLRIGMDRRDVQRLLGPPLAQLERGSNEAILVYAQPCQPCGNGIEISVLLKDERVEAAGAEFWDMGVWWCRHDACPVILDSSTFNRLLGSAGQEAETANWPMEPTSATSRAGYDRRVRRRLMRSALNG